MATYLRFLYRQFFEYPAALPVSLSLASQTGIITGSNTGLGLAAAAQLLSRDLGQLILAVRSVEKGATARAQLLKDHPGAKIEVWPLDLESYASITAFVDKCKTLPRIDFIILNAGVVKLEFDTNKQTGNEVTVQTNWLSTGLLAMLLLPVLEASAASEPRLTLIGSETAEWASFKEKNSVPILNALNDRKNFDPDDRYYTSKLLQIYFFREFVKRAGKTKVVINTVNPGFCYGSDLHRDVAGLRGIIFTAVKRAIGRSTPMGARTLANAGVVQSNESHGRYLEDCKIKEDWQIFDTEKSKRVQKELWDEMMKELTSVGNLSRYTTSI